MAITPHTNARPRAIVRRTEIHISSQRRREQHRQSRAVVDAGLFFGMAIRPKETARHEYAAKLTWTGANAGPTSSYQAYSRDYEYQCGDKAVARGSADPHFRGDGSLYNPEELLVVALSTCHLLGYLALCARSGVHVVAYEDDAQGTMATDGPKGRFTDVVLRPRVTVAAGTNLERAQKLHDEAHDECYIAASVNFPVRHEPTITVAPSSSATTH